MIALAVFGIGLGVAIPLWSKQRQIEREDALLDAGRELARALRSYQSFTPGNRGPESLSDLLEDRRSGGLRRHLRSIPQDPLMENADWGLLRDNGNHILGVFSRSELPVLRDKTPVGARLVSNETESRQIVEYRDWVFLADPFAPLASQGGR